jgi:hypothetical protein
MAFSGNARKCVERTLAILDATSCPIVVAEIELSKISVQMLLATVLIGTLHATLENAEITLNRVVWIVRSCISTYSP